MRKLTPPTIVLWIVTLFYAYGALVHVLNMLSLSGFDWLTAPLKWQLLDVIYLVIDVTVCVGLTRRHGYAILSFYVAAASQIVLYTALRDWIMDVPEAFAVTPSQESYLTVLVIFHLVTLTAVTFALRASRDGAD